MATVTVTTTEQTLDSLGASELGVRNTGSSDVIAGPFTLRPGQYRPISTPVSAHTVSGTSTVETSIAVAGRDTGSEVASQVVSAEYGDGTTDATAHIQAKINATPSGGLLFVPRGTYKLTAALTIPAHITIEGASLSETWQPRTQGGALNRPNAPYAVGAVLEQATAGADCVTVTGSGVAVHLRNLACTWASAIRHTDTGHGVNVSPTLAGGSGGHDSGALSFRWDNLVVAGHDGNHYAVRLLNSMYGTLSHVRSYGGGVLLVECDSHEGNYGNLTVNHLYGEVFNAGTADGVRLSARVNAPAVTGVLNLMTFLRPQVNITGAAATAGTQAFWNSAGGAGLPVGVDVISPDLEGTGGNPINFGGVNSGTIARGGGILNGTPAGGYDMGPGASYKKFTATGSFRVPDGVFKLRCRAVGSGGGGGGGGSALTSGGVSTQVGGGGGGAGQVADATIDVTPNQTDTITVGAAGAAGTGGAVNSNAGTAGGTGARSSFGSLCRADGGGGGAGGGANSTSAVGGGIFGTSGSTTTQRIPGAGGVSQNPNGLAATPIPPGVVGGGGGGAATATLGGGGGSAFTLSEAAYAAQGGGNSGASGTTAGVNGTVATAPGCGGGGGGGGAPGGAGGNGGAGAPGLVEVWW